MLHAERGLFELQRGRLLLIASEVRTFGALGRSSNGVGGAGSGIGEAEIPVLPLLVAPVEGLDAALLAALRRLASEPPRLIVTRHRARAMGLGVPCPTSLLLGDDATPDGILALSSSRGKPGELAQARAADRYEAAGLALARLGRLLPAVVAAPVDPDEPGLIEVLGDGRLLRVSPEEVGVLEARAAIEVVSVSDAPVPLEEAEDARFILFRETPSLLEHVAILIGDSAAWPDPVPVRLHSACLTGDLFGSLRCDCGEQLHGSLRYFAEKGGGVLLYLAQEGRGIGLGNKLRAYTMQQEGLDTIEADGSLGFGPDERRYEAAVKILAELGVERVQLLTNNPEKLEAVERGGIEVADRRGIHGTLNPHNLPYMEAKVRKAGHWLEEMLREGIDDAEREGEAGGE